LEQAITHLLLVESVATDELTKIKRGGVERVVARARLRGGDVLTFTIERRPRPCSRLHYLSERDQPRRRQRGILRSAAFPLIRPAGGVPARRQTDVTTVTAHIDPRANLARAVADFDVEVPSKNQMLATARSDGCPGGWEWPALRGQLVERGLAVDFLGR